MAKSIHERVRAQIEKRERDEATRVARSNDAHIKRLEDTEQLREAALESLCDDYGFDEDLRPTDAQIKERMRAMRRAGKGNSI